MRPHSDALDSAPRQEAGQDPPHVHKHPLEAGQSPGRDRDRAAGEDHSRAHVVDHAPAEHHQDLRLDVAVHDTTFSDVAALVRARPAPREHHVDYLRLPVRKLARVAPAALARDDHVPPAQVAHQDVIHRGSRWWSRGAHDRRATTNAS